MHRKNPCGVRGDIAAIHSGHPALSPDDPCVCCWLPKGADAKGAGFGGGGQHTPVRVSESGIRFEVCLYSEPFHIPNPWEYKYFCLADKWYLENAWHTAVLAASR